MHTPTIIRTSATNPHFQLLIAALDRELWDELKEDQATYDQHNKVPELHTVCVAYFNDEPVACGCFKMKNDHTAEIKRMYVTKEARGNGLSKLILAELENWAREKGFRRTILETSIHFAVAKQLYISNGYSVIENYPPYVGLQESVCMEKIL